MKFPYWSISTDKHAERTLNPYGLYRDARGWYVVGQDLDRKDLRTFKVSRIEGDIRFATRRERDFRTPAEFDVDAFRGRPEWQIADVRGEARIEMAHDTAWWVQREYGDRGRFEDDVFVTPYSSADALAAWVLRQDGRAKPTEPPEVRRAIAAALRKVRVRRTRAPRRSRRAIRSRRERVNDGDRPVGPVVPERFALLQALLAYLLARCGDSPSAVSRRTRSSRPSTSPRTSSRIISRSSRSSTSAAAATPSTRSSKATSSGSTRSSTVTPSARRRA